MFSIKSSDRHNGTYALPEEYQKEKRENSVWTFLVSSGIEKP